MSLNMTLRDIVEGLDGPRAKPEGLRRVAVAGEFGSGKSSTINAILRDAVLPSDPGLPGRPLVKLSFGERAQIVAEDRAGRGMQLDAVAELMPRGPLAWCDIRLPLPLLRGIELVEVPSGPAGGLAPADLQLVAESDMLIWVTIGSQAWRLSEKTIVEALPAAIRARSVLAVSRADKLRAGSDFDKIELRLQHEASPFFNELVFMQASQDNLRNAREQRIWQRTGGAELANVVLDMAADARAA